MRFFTGQLVRVAVIYEDKIKYSPILIKIKAINNSEVSLERNYFVLTQRKLIFSENELGEFVSKEITNSGKPHYYRILTEDEYEAELIKTLEEEKIERDWKKFTLTMSLEQKKLIMKTFTLKDIE